MGVDFQAIDLTNLGPALQSMVDEISKIFGDVTAQMILAVKWQTRERAFTLV